MALRKKAAKDFKNRHWEIDYQTSATGPKGKVADILQDFHIPPSASAPNTTAWQAFSVPLLWQPLHRGFQPLPPPTAGCD